MGYRQGAMKGFTLIELMTVVVIVAIITMIALPSYQEQARRGKRAEAKAYLVDLASRQERFYTQYSSYTNVIAKPTSCAGAACGLGMEDNSSSDNHYTSTLAVTPTGCSPAGTLCVGYTLTVTPNDADAKCATLTYSHAGEKGATGTMGADYCWR